MIMMMIVVINNDNGNTWEGRHMGSGVVPRCHDHIVKPRIIENQTLISSFSPNASYSDIHSCGHFAGYLTSPHPSPRRSSSPSQRR